MKNVIAIFDVGKTNKKLLLFDEQYKVVFERIAKFPEIGDEDGFPCENLESLRSSVFDSLSEGIRNKEFNITAVNFSGYGASFVYLDEHGDAIAPLYNYLKPFDEKLLDQFYSTYGGKESFSQRTASPILGNLNSGMQLYRLKYEKPALFAHIHQALHLPQYLAYLVSGKKYSDMTSIGCHTNLWDFTQNQYHEWVTREGIAGKLAPVIASHATEQSNFAGHSLQCGVGLHDSSAALIPYLVNFKEPFLLISTGTWCITLNPFNYAVLTQEELQQDCLCYLQYNGKPVKHRGCLRDMNMMSKPNVLLRTFNWTLHFIATLLLMTKPLPHYKKRMHKNVFLYRNVYFGKEICQYLYQPTKLIIN